MEARVDVDHGVTNEGRPYRSHLHPACFSCKRRKSRCKTKGAADICIMCQAHGTECVFPRPDDPYGLRENPPRTFPAAAGSRSIQARHDHLYRPYPRPHIRDNGTDTAAVTATDDNRLEDHLMGIVAEAGDDSSHVVSPAVADDNDILESYLSAVPTSQRRSLVRTRSASNRPLRQVRFNLVPRKPLGVTANQSLAASKCEVIEKYMDPDIDEFINLFFLKANPCFPVFDEASFRSAYASHKEQISPALLCNLYANSLVYWKSSTKLRSRNAPDIRFVWNQANEALHSELFLSPGISTVMSIIINVCGRPSTSMFGNGGMVGTAVALCNALGLNRDPTDWDISPLEKGLRIRIWWLVTMHDRWCSLAYGTPLQVHCAQYDVPHPSVDDICSTAASAYHRAAASIFVALTTLTDVLARYLEHVYHVSKTYPQSSVSPVDLERMLSEWEESLSGDIRRIVLRGTHLDTAGAANFRLAYLAVKLLLRRIQLALHKSTMQVEDDTGSPFYIQAERAAEDIAHLVQELDETQLRGFWIPVHAFSLTSASMFLLRSGLRKRNQNRNTPLGIAREMIDTLRRHRQVFDWDLSDHCLGHCGELIERIGMADSDSDMTFPGLSGLSDDFDVDTSILDELFLGVAGFSEGFGL